MIHPDKGRRFRCHGTIAGSGGTSSKSMLDSLSFEQSGSRQVMIVAAFFWLTSVHNSLK
jgi:hypothetical protein